MPSHAPESRENHIHRPTFWLLVLGVCGLLTYGSLYPFDFHYPPPSGAFRHFLALRAEDLHLGDIVANLLLFAPLGCILAYPAGHRVRGVALAAVAGLALGLLLQGMQVLVPTRVPSLWDAGWNTIGSVLGGLAGILVSPLLPRLQRSGQVPTVTFPFVLAGLWLAVETFPFVPALDWQPIKDALKPLLVAPAVHPIAVLENATGWGILAWLWRSRAWLPWPRIGPVLALGATVVLQVLIVHRAPSLSGLIGGMAGLTLMLIPLPERVRPVVLIALLGCYLIIDGLAPFNLSESPGEFHWVPFAGFLQGHLLNGAWVGLQKLFWYGALLELLLALGLRTSHASGLGVALLLGIEYGQRWVATGHVAEITDPLLLVLMAWARKASRAARTNEPSPPPSA